jgi:hypothetical protein
MTPLELDAYVRSAPTGLKTRVLDGAAQFYCPPCGRWHGPVDLASGFWCVSCTSGLPSADRPNCPDCTAKERT